MLAILHHGINCYIQAVLSCAEGRGLDFQLAFCALFDETELFFDESHKVFYSKRLFSRLKMMGMRLTRIRQSPKTALICPITDETFIMGSDTFFIPWSPAKSCIHSPHYFYAAFCGRNYRFFDPIYGKEGVVLPSELAAIAYDVKRVQFEPNKKGKAADFAHNLRQIDRSYPDKILQRLRKMTAQLALKYTDGLISNRYLFRQFLERVGSTHASRFSDDYFRLFQRAKFDLYKSKLTGGCDLLAIEKMLLAEQKMINH